jgi:uncharacterized protein (TIGR02246 family)
MNRMIIATIAASLALQAIPAQSRSQECNAVNASDIQMFFDQWEKALATGDPKKVAVRYAPDAVLLSTLSERPRKNRAEIESYFVEFLKKKPRGTIVSRTIKIGCNEAFDVGLYTFQVNGAVSGERVAVKARFSLIYEVRNGRWVITHHHSSELPHQADDGFNLESMLRQAINQKDRCVVNFSQNKDLSE